MYVSNFTTGAVLSQMKGDGLYHPVGFMSKGFSNVEQNYQVHDKELLAIFCALEEWQHFLEGALKYIQTALMSSHLFMAACSNVSPFLSRSLFTLLCLM